MTLQKDPHLRELLSYTSVGRPVLPIGTLAVAAVTGLLAGPARGGVPVRVTGTSRVEVRTIHQDGQHLIRGRVVDDRGLAIAAGDVQIDGAGSLARACEGSVVTQREGATVTLSGTGRGFCLATPVGNDDAPQTATVRYLGDEFHTPSTAVKVEVGGERATPALEFVPAPRRLPLDGSARVTVHARVDGPSRPPRVLQVAIALARPSNPEVPLTTVALTPGTRKTVELEARRLGAPGVAELVARFPGSPSLRPTEARRRVLVSDVAVLSAQALEPVPAGSRVEILVGVRGTRGPVDGGLVELMDGNRAVSSVPVGGGLARVVFQAPPEATERRLSVRYVAARPWWRPGSAVPLTLTVTAARGIGSWPWILALGIVLAFSLRGWWRPLGRRKAPASASPGPRPRPVLEVVRAGPADGGWHGTVVDAHEGHALGGAQVTIKVPAFDGEGVAARSLTGPDGAFELPPVPNAEGRARLEAWSEEHARTRLPLPRPGELRIQLTTRRRKILAVFLDWARSRGRPWVSTADPTPAEVRRIARSREDEGAERWAEAVEEAAFGPGPVDEMAERQVRAKEPPS